MNNLLVRNLGKRKGVPSKPKSLMYECLSLKYNRPFPSRKSLSILLCNFVKNGFRDNGSAYSQECIMNLVKCEMGPCFSMTYDTKTKLAHKKYQCPSSLVIPLEYNYKL